MVIPVACTVRCDSAGIVPITTCYKQEKKNVRRTTFATSRKITGPTSTLCASLVLVCVLFTTIVLVSSSSPVEAFQQSSKQRRIFTIQESFLSQRNNPRDTLVLKGSPAEDDGGKSKPRIRFTGTEEYSSAALSSSSSSSTSSSTITNPLDAFFVFLASDIVSIGLGLIGLVIVVINRLFALGDDDATAVEALAVQTRTDLLAVFACGSVLLNGITKLDVTTALAESVILDGTKLSQVEFIETPSSSSSSSSPIATKMGETDVVEQDENQSKIVWALESILTAILPIQSAILLERTEANTKDDDYDNDTETSPTSTSTSSSSWHVMARGGIVPPRSTSVPELSPIVDRVASPGNVKETYLPTLQALPGKKEFPYLPVNAQLALLIPIGNVGGGGGSPSEAVTTDRVLVLASNQAKSVTPRDVAWCRIVAERLTTIK